MKVVKQSSASENAVATLSNLVQLLRIDVTKSSLIEFRNHPEYPSLSSISDTLADWGVESLAMNASLPQLKEIPYPAIAHLTKNSGHFVVIKKLDQELLLYIDPEIGEIRETLAEFEKKWSGVVLLVEATEKSGEENYKEKRRVEIFENASQSASWVLLAFGFVTFLSFMPTDIFPLYFLKIIGIKFCLVLLHKQFGLTGTSLNAFCEMGTKTNCDAVIHSSASKLFGLVHLSEIGSWYFIGGLLALIISSLAGIRSIGLIFLLNLSALPFSIYSIYYQWRVLNKWCPLCVSVMVILWLECLAGYILSYDFSFSLVSTYIGLFSFTLPFALWLSIRKRFIESLQVQSLKINLSRFVKNEQIFQKLLENQPDVQIGDFEIETILGDKNAPIEITIASNPICDPCAHAHKVLGVFPELFENKVSIKYRVHVNPLDDKGLAYQAFSHLISLKLSVHEHNFHAALSAWFSIADKTNIGKWKKSYPLTREIDQIKIHEVIGHHYQWFKSVGIRATPTIFVNNKQLPEEFSINDLKFQIGKMIERLSVIEHELIS